MPLRFVFNLSRSSVEPFLTYSTRADLREKIYQAWSTRGADRYVMDGSIMHHMQACFNIIS